MQAKTEKELNFMAVPKKKVSRSRRNQRRHSIAYQLDPVTASKDPFVHEPVRAHTVSMKTIREGLYQPRAKKSAKSSTKTA